MSCDIKILYLGIPNIHTLHIQIYVHTYTCAHTDCYLSYLLYIGSQLMEFDVLMKYYSYLMELLLDVFDYSVFVKAEIITKEDNDFIDRYIDIDCYKIILIKTVNHLLSGNTNLFYKLLETIQSNIPNGDKLTFKMRTEIILLNQKMLTGMFVNVLVSAYI